MDFIQNVIGWCSNGQSVHHARKFAILPGWAWCEECGCWRHLDQPSNHHWDAFYQRREVA